MMMFVVSQQLLGAVYHPLAAGAGGFNHPTKAFAKFQRTLLLGQKNRENCSGFSRTQRRSKSE